MQEQLIHYIRRFITVTDEELNKIVSCFRPLEAEKNELLVVAGQTSQRTFFVGKGCIRIFFITEEGQEATRYIAFENNMATALCSFISNEPSLEFIQALEPSELLCISHEDFYHLLEVIPAWEKFHRHYLEKAYVNNTNRLMSFLTLSAKERYRQVLEVNPEIVRRLPNKIVATYLNISQETLSRLKSKI
ncbi:cyclic nucleotide-binding domain-containing protein [Emticicia sp. CRIBPO]|uniref:Crp/Fnr family transcriptional regulator n=1 Tax=Emticicia sp. CRIBPO TaxID=2683258 RepID=UPI001412A38B|nr:Crp/Fnr family transcriptional regulator [Emticicia sp. CRIBPO]NBA85540.1 cyclic nucleotide-binding domain-containing protein [Emticicia sp. CRIBPO]